MCQTQCAVTLRRASIPVDVNAKATRIIETTLYHVIAQLSKYHIASIDCPFSDAVYVSFQVLHMTVQPEAPPFAAPFPPSTLGARLLQDQQIQILC